jgi:hypothetical protein
MILKVEYHGEIEVLFEMALYNESGDQVGSIHEKTRCRKSRETIPLSKTFPINNNSTTKKAGHMYLH